MKLGTQLAATKIDSALSRTEQAQYCCSVAKQLEKAGDYEAAREALGEFWPERSGPPTVEGLDRQTTAEVLLRVGALVGWLSSAHQSERQESAKDLITKSIEIFGELGETQRVAEAQSDLGLCYWRGGAFDEARDVLREAIRKLGTGENEIRATALIRSAIVEKTAARYVEALNIYREASPVVEATNDHAIQGAFHHGLATLLNCMGLTENRPDYIDQALIEFAAASVHFEQAGHTHFCGPIENNLGFLFTTIGKFPEAHKHIDRARDIFLSLGDRGHVAQVDDTRARAYLAEGNVRQAERYARAAVKTLSRGDECSLLVEALTTHGVALARLGRYPIARSELERAIKVAETCGDLEGAGRARLSIIEELSGQTSAIEMASIYKSATDLLQASQDPSAERRLISCGRIVIDSLLAAELAAEAESTAPKAEGWEGFSLKRELRAFENSLVERALRDAGGAVTKASRLLGFNHHQSLISVISSRHKNLLNTRSAIRKRRHHLVSHPKRTKRKAAPKPAERPTSQISILHVEDNAMVAKTVGDMLAAQNWLVDLCTDGDTALKKLTSDEHYDLILVDNDLPGLSGLELAQRARKITHRRRTPIVMFSGDDYEEEAWQARVNAFVKKPDQINELPSTITRVLETARGHN